MVVFSTVAFLLVVAALLFLLPPLVQRQSSKSAVERKELNIMLYRDQLAELEADLKSEIITRDQFDQAHADLERSLLQDVADDGGNKKSGITVSGNLPAIVVGIAVPLVAISLYAHLGKGKDGFDPENFRPGMTTEGHEGTLEQQVRKLQDHLQQNPDDMEGWVMLARSYYFMKQYQAASDAFARTVAMTGENNPGLLADYADALAMANGRNMAGKPYDLVKKALTMDPNHQKSLWLAATATYQVQDYKTTLEYWLTLRQQFPEGSDNYLQMTRNIAEVKQFLGMSIDDEVAIVQKAEAGAASAEADGVAGAAAKVSGVVSLDPSMQDKISPSDTLFVFARAASGPRMPLAIIRTSVSDLPLTFTLDDSLAMNPQMKISKFKDVIVGARISKTGNAMPQSGDLSGQTDVVPLGSEGLQITIDGVVP
ncbi:MAG: c-type cytochrome biogenesis protein CcmI [Gammaproteobacteria bacterium]|nr:c-type cytochrome biogenesis protein CcmI [Gammaproteobacteria bacterium]